MLRSLVGSEMCIRDSDAPYLHVALRSSYQYQIGYVTDFNFSRGTIVDAPSDLFVDLPLLPPVPPEYVDQQEPGSSAFAHHLFGIALDGVPIYSGLIDQGVYFFHVIESASPPINPTSSDSSGLSGTTTPSPAGSVVSNMKVDFCGGSYGPTEPMGKGTTVSTPHTLSQYILSTRLLMHPLTYLLSDPYIYPLPHTHTFSDMPQSLAPSCRCSLSLPRDAHMSLTKPRPTIRHHPQTTAIRRRHLPTSRRIQRHQRTSSPRVLPHWLSYLQPLRCPRPTTNRP